MSTVDSIERTVQKTNEWIAEAAHLAAELPQSQLPAEIREVPQGRR